MSHTSTRGWWKEARGGGGGGWTLLQPRRLRRRDEGDPEAPTWGRGDTVRVAGQGAQERLRPPCPGTGQRDAAQALGRRLRNHQEAAVC